MIKRLRACILSVLMLSLTLSGCASKKSKSDSESSSELTSSDEDLVIEMTDQEKFKSEISKVTDFIKGEYPSGSFSYAITIDYFDTDERFDLTNLSEKNRDMLIDGSYTWSDQGFNFNMNLEENNVLLIDGDADSAYMDFAVIKDLMTNSNTWLEEYDTFTSDVPYGDLFQYLRFEKSEFALSMSRIIRMLYPGVNTTIWQDDVFTLFDEDTVNFFKEFTDKAEFNDNTVKITIDEDNIESFEDMLRYKGQQFLYGENIPYSNSFSSVEYELTYDISKLDQFHHIVVTRDDSIVDMKLFVNDKDFVDLGRTKDAATLKDLTSTDMTDSGFVEISLMMALNSWYLDSYADAETTSD